MSDISIIKRPSEARGQTKFEWLQSRHTFSFGEFYDPDFIGFCSLRIINEDIISPKNGFGMHPHHSMEIFTFIVSGSLRHEDSLGNQKTISAGDFQYMSAGRGVMHSEINPSESESVHFLQIWLEPETEGGSPIYREIKAAERINRDSSLVLLASGNGRDDSIMIRQCANLWFGKMEGAESLQISPESGGRNFWIQIIEGDVEISDQNTFLLSGDGAAVSSMDGFSIKSNEPSEFILFEL